MERKDWEPFLADLRAVLTKHRLKLRSRAKYYYCGDDIDEMETEYAFVDEWDGWYASDGEPPRALPMVDLISWIEPIIDRGPEITRRALEGIDEAKPLSELPPADVPLCPSRNGGTVID